MVDGQAKRNAGQGACPTRIAIDQSFRVKLCTIGIRSPKNGDEIVIAVFIN